VVLISINTVVSTVARTEAVAAARPRAAAALVGSANVSPLPAVALIGLTEPAVQRAAQAAPPKTPVQDAAQVAALLGDANLALFLSALVAMGVLVWQRGLSLRQLETPVERALMSGGVIILITAAGGAFGDMLKQARIGEEIESLFGREGHVSGLMLLGLGFLVAAVLKVAQGSSTVAMITASGMLASMAASPRALGFDPVYLALAIGSGSLVGSWMNDSGFWIVSKMGGFTEVETLKSWTILLIVLGCAGFVCTVLLALAVPFPTG
jgi:GntP family gluconate:H+ symporter